MSTEASAPKRRRRPPGPLSGLGFGLIALVVLLDQGSKWIAETSLPYGEAFPVLPILSLYRTYNTGVAFSMFAGAGPWVLVIAMLAITAMVLYLWARADEGGRLAAAGYALIVGGALGNLIDRFVHGHVVDFLLLHFGAWTPFVFNLADAGLTIGPAILVVVFAWPKRG